MPDDVSKAPKIRVSTRGPKAASDAADPVHAAGAADGGQEDQSVNRERGNPRSFDITFRELRDEDLPLMHRWLNDPAVVQWWEGADVSWPAVVSRYGSGRSTPVEHWIALIQGDPVGWAQCYCAADVAEGEAYHWKGHLGLREAAGIDYLVGEPTQRGRGTGSAMIRAFVRDVVFARHPEWAFAAAGPFEANVASWRALENAGFRRVAVLDDEDGPCVLMVVSRDDFVE